MPKSAKKDAWDWCSKYIRLRDAIAYQEKYPDVPFGYVKCCTCHRILIWNKNCDAGHYISKGSRGMSGVYFDERNIHAQCKECNGFFQGRQVIYHEFMLEKYGQDVIDKLEFLNQNQSYKNKIIGIGLLYKQMFEDLRGIH
jgi:hypothetical protein